MVSIFPSDIYLLVSNILNTISISNSTPLLSYALHLFKKVGSKFLSNGEYSESQPTLSAAFVSYVELLYVEFKTYLKLS